MTTIQQPVATAPPVQLTTDPSLYGDRVLSALVDHPDVSAMSGEQQRQVAHQVCADFDAGADVEVIRSGLIEVGLPRSAASQVIKAAVTLYCSDYMPEAFGYAGGN
ncbi:DUF732 domain-containing protein [Prescottella agglutinans]|uniref:DUF732 domain-containing protein n=1 Tax=Prescottella agglutinans TaxID=1644129 RepID=UPI002475CAD1|nr:DUF732 domain-containing protein [Prescottella agglutinans]